MENTINKLAEILRDIADDANDQIIQDVINTCLDSGETDEDILCWFKNMQHGCSSGMVSHLIYYADTHKYFDKHYDQIEEYRSEWKQWTGEDIHPPGDTDLKNWFAWFAFEHATSKVSDELERKEAQSEVY